MFEVAKEAITGKKPDFPEPQMVKPEQRNAFGAEGARSGRV